MRSLALLVLASVLVGGCSAPANDAPSTTSPPATTTSTTMTSSTTTSTTTTSPFLVSSTTPHATPDPTGINNASGLACDPRVHATFRVNVTDTANVSAIMPLGNVVPNGVVKSHGFVALAGNATRVPVVAPTDSTLFRLAWYVEEGAEQWLLFLQTDCDQFYIVDHLDDVAPAIRAVAPTAPSQGTASQNLARPVALGAGDALGYVHARGSGGAFDLGAYDLRTTAPFANLSRHTTDRELHAICPWGLYPPQTAAFFEARFARPGTPPVPGSSCRSSSRDVPGTAAGQWYRDGAAMALAADVDGSVIVSIQSPFVYLRQEPPATDPSALHAGDAACYHDAATHAWVRVGMDGTLRVAAGDGACGAEPPASDATAWVR